MKIAIITPCRNAAPLLRSTIESILQQSAVLRNDVEFEYWIQDGASGDETAELVAGFADERIRFHSEPDAGMYDALSKGLRKVDADVVAYLNAGDIYFSKAFEVIAEVFSQPRVDWVTGYSVLMNGVGQFTAAWKPPRYRREFVLNGTYLQGHPIPGIQQESTFWSGKANQTIDLDRLSKFRLGGDYFIWTELARNFELHSAMSLLAAFCQHSGQLSEQMTGYLEEARGATRLATQREKLTAYWEFNCNPWLKRFLWNHLLPPSAAKLFEYRADLHAWAPR